MHENFHQTTQKFNGRKANEFKNVLYENLYPICKLFENAEQRVNILK